MPDASRAQARRDAGLCTACGQQAPVEGRAKCEVCLERARSYEAQRRAAAAAKKLCEACRVRKRARGRGNRCASCADKYLARQNERARRKRASAKTAPQNQKTAPSES